MGDGYALEPSLHGRLVSHRMNRGSSFLARSLLRYVVDITGHSSGSICGCKHDSCRKC